MPEAGVWICVAAVAEEVDVEVGNAGIFGALDQGFEVGEFGVLVAVSGRAGLRSRSIDTTHDTSV